MRSRSVLITPFIENPYLVIATLIRGQAKKVLTWAGGGDNKLSDKQTTDNQTNVL